MVIARKTSVSFVSQRYCIVANSPVVAWVRAGAVGLNFESIDLLQRHLTAVLLLII